MEEHKRDRRPKPTSKAKHARKTAPHATDRPVSASCIPLIRGVVNVIACFESKTTEAVHDDLGALMGRPGAHIDNLKSGRVALRDTETAVLAMAGARRGYLTRAWGQKLLQTAAGQSFLTKLRASNTMLDPMLDEVMIQLTPGALRRFADKVDADEAERRAAQAVK